MLRIDALRGSGRKRASRKLAALRATQTSGCLIRLRPPLLGATPKGTQYRPLAVARSEAQLLGRRIVLGRKPTKTWVTTPVSTRQRVRSRSLNRGAYLRPLGTATQTRSGEGCPAHCAGAASMSEDRQSDPSSGRIPSARASECTGASRRRCAGCPFLCLLSFGQAKESESHSSAKQKVR